MEISRQIQKGKVSFNMQWEELIINDVMECGIYGIRDLETNKIVYVGSTNVSFAARWSQHIFRYKNGNHCNKELVKLFDSKKYRFCILEICTGYKNEEILQREKYLSEKYHTLTYGVAINCGGGRTLTPCNNAIKFKQSKEVIECRQYIRQNWICKKININDRDVIMTYLSNNIETSAKFMCTIKKLGFTIQRYADKCHWIIS